LVVANSLDMVRVGSFSNIPELTKARYRVRLVQLNNRQGQTPCCITQQLLIPCQGQIAHMSALEIPADDLVS
jgi:hypothetical protein